ncbi:MAG: dihydropteroate synthase [candidate division Zixibacteria bacterium]|nr:dihydropteroate synthase [candidate division Zixibacteria bacterium]
MQKQVLNRPEEIKAVIPFGDGRELPLSRPLVMGVLNVTPDSFSDGGKYAKPRAAVRRATEMIKQGANIIDIGGESTRPGAEPIDAETEIERVIPVIESIRKKSDIPISIDTYKARVAEIAISAGADIVNDISALQFDQAMPDVVANCKVPVVLMHMQGTPGQMQQDPHYDDCIGEIQKFFLDRIEFCKLAGIDKSKIILDPGIGFGKRLSDNTQILANLETFKSFSLPILIGVSRKSFIGMINPTDSKAANRIGGSIAAALLAIQNGANIVRVHDVAETVEAIKVIKAIRVEI